MTSLHPSVLVVDDSAVMRTMIGKSLAGAGLPKESLRFAENGRIALESIRADQPDLVVTDVMMPEMTGIELVEALSSEGLLERFPVVVVTSVSNSRELLSLVRLGAAAVIRKPIDLSGLARELTPFVSALMQPPEPEPEPAPEVDLVLDLRPKVLDHNAALGKRVSALLARCNLGHRVADEATGARIFYGAAVEVEKPFAAELVLWAHQEATNHLARALWGAEPGRDDGIRLDAVSELLNVVSGEYLQDVTAELGDVEHESRYGVPRSFVVSPRTTVPDGAMLFDLGDDELIAVHVRMKSSEVGPR